MRKSLLLSTAALFGLVSPAWADDAASPETVVVTATRTPQPLNLTGASLSVITSEDLLTQQTVILTDILAETPGLTVNRNGGAGQTTSISIRGAETGQTLALVDGVRINDPSSVDDQAILGDLLVNNIDRVEILRGPQSTLYGSDAIGGVINVLTRRGGDGAYAISASAEGGSFDTYHGNVAANGSIAGLEYGAAVNYFNTGGTSAADKANGNTESDAYRNFGATANTRYTVDENLSVDLRAYYTDSHTDFDGYPPPTYTFRDTPEYGTANLIAGYAGVNLSLLGGKLKNRLAFIGSESDRKNYGAFDFFTNDFSPAENFVAKGDAARFEYQGIYDFDDANQVTFGAETQRVGLSTQSFPYDPGPTKGHNRISGYYAQYQTTLFDQLTLTGGVRLDDDDEFGTHTSLKFAGAWNIPGYDTTLRANYGDGFKAPTLYQLYSQYSNPLHNLNPESARGWEVGIDHLMLDGKLRGSVTYFERRTHNQIDFLSPDCYDPPIPNICKTRPYGYYENLVRTKATGVEAELAAKLSETLSLSVNYTNMADTNLETGLALARRPDNQASGTITWLPLPELTVGASFIYTGPRYNDSFSTTRLANNTTFNLFGAYAVTDKIALYGRVENLLDDQNEPVIGYGRIGRAAYGGVRVGL